eukprot:TRINITY_DN3742_c0_g1_i3.p1 TRINITY_DN3742_c0_g1~~TRINITY_DN3742_c0_g1_i3.p1  ORF type:complete len:1116 (-),score=252.97 TRINITY_DN3742_c0_g1_i3:59-3406(-)
MSTPVAAVPMPPGKVPAAALASGEGDSSPLSPGVVSPDGQGLAAADPAALFKVANAIVGAIAIEAARGQAGEDGLLTAGVQDKAAGDGKGRGGKSKAKGRAKAAPPPRTPQKSQNGHASAAQSPLMEASPWTPLEFRAEAAHGEDNGGNCAEDSEEERALSGHGASGKGGHARSAATHGGARSGAFRPGKTGNPTPRLPLPPQSGSLKALPSRHVQDFLAQVKEGRYGEAQEALRQIRATLGSRGRSKEAFGGMRALLHYLLESYGCSDCLDEALKLLEDMKSGTEARLVGPAAFNAVLRGLLARSAFEQARRVVRTEMPQLGVTPNEASLNLLMDTAARSGPHNLEEAWNILEEMQRQNLKADKYTVSILTKHISDRTADKRRVSRGITLVEHFLQTQPEDVDEVLVNSVLDVFCRMGDMPRLEATLQRMKEYGIKGSAVTYGTIVKAYGRAGNIDKVVQAWTELQQHGLEANSVTYGCMLDACVKCGHLDKAIQIFDVMKQRGLHRNTILYATLIKGFAKSKDPLAARRLYKEMVAEGVTCNVVVYNSLIDACVRANDLQGAAEVLQEMTAAHVQPDLITFSTLIKGYCSSGELSKAMRLQEELRARDLECDEIVYNSLLEGCVKAGDIQRGLCLFSEMRQRGVRPSAVTFSILVKLLSRAGRLDLAIHLVSKEMRDVHGVAPNRMVWSCLVTCCVKARDLSKAVLSLELLDVEGAAAGTARASMYAAVIEGSMTSGEVSTALQLIELAYNRAPPEDNTRVLLSMDLLKRVFETAGLKGLEAEAQAVLNSIAPRISDQVRSALAETLGRRSKRELGSVEADSVAGAAPETTATPEEESLTPAAWPGSPPTATQQWQQPPYSHHVGQGYPVAEAAAIAAMLSHQLPGVTGPAMDASAAAAAMAANVAAANVAAATAASYPGYGSWPQPGLEGFGYPFQPVLPSMAVWPGAEMYGAARWPYPLPAHAWEEGMPWAAAAAATAPVPAGMVQGVPSSGVLSPPTSPSSTSPTSPTLQAPVGGIESVSAPFSSTPGPLATTPATPAAGRSQLKTFDFDHTPATTAGRSTLLRSPEDDAEDEEPASAHMPLQKMLFGGEGANGHAEGSELMLDGPPGLC